jgi:hypothetical protein
MDGNGGFHNHGDTPRISKKNPIAGWFISWKNRIENG